jgi:MFS family permease
VLTGTPATDPARRAAWSVLWPVLWPGIAALAAAMGLGRFVYTPILPEMLASGALNLREAGWVASANFAGYLVGAMLALAVTDRGMQARLARAALLATVVLAAAMATTGSVAAWSLARFGAGLASAFVLVFMSARIFERLLALGAADRIIWMFSGVGIGIVASALLGLAADALGVDWPGMWFGAAALALAFGVPAWRALSPSRELPSASPAGPPADPAAPRAAGAGTPDAATPDAAMPDTSPPDTSGRRALVAAVVAYGLFGMGYVIHATYLPAMVRAAGYPSQAALWIWILVGLAALPSMLVWGAVARRWGERRAIAACYLMQGVTALTPLFGASLAAAAVAAVGLGAGFMAVTGMALGYARRLDPGRAARTIGILTAAFGLGQVFGPVAAAYLAEALGFAWPSLLAFTVLVAAAAAMRVR